MYLKKLITVVLILPTLIAFSSFPIPGQANTQDDPPVIIMEDSFHPAFWTVSAETSGGASYTVSQQPTGGYGTPPFRLMSHVLPPVTGDGLAIAAVTHIYDPGRYDPRFEGEISFINYTEAGIILSFPFPDAFTTVQPALLQGGRIFRSPQFFRYIAQNSSHDWEVKSLTGLTAEDFVAIDGSGDHPDFTELGSIIRFGFTRTNSRGSTQPPVPPGQDMVIDHGVDQWQVTVHRAPFGGNEPPVAADDTFILDGNDRNLPLLEFFSVVDNDSDPERDRLAVTEVTEPLYGSAGILSDHTVVYQLSIPQPMDSFDYTVSDGMFTDTAHVQVLIDCACTVLCLNGLEPPAVHLAGVSQDNIDLPLIYRVRDQVLKTTPDGNRYVNMYYHNNPEILVNIIMSETLRLEALAAVELWQGNLSSLTDGDGSAVITQAQVDAVDSFLDHLSSVSSAELQQVIADERLRLGPLDGYVGLTMSEAKRQAIGDPTLFLPLVQR